MGKTAAITFGDAADAYIKAKLPEWSNDKHIWQWNQTLGDAYCKSLRSRPVADGTVDDVLNVLQPIWTTKTEAATRLRGRIEKVLNHAKARKWRDRPNPAVWRGHLNSALPNRRSSRPGGIIQRCPTRMSRRSLRGSAIWTRSPAARSLAILTAARSAEILNAEWSEIDFGAAVWTVPAERMKMRKRPCPSRAARRGEPRSIKDEGLSDRWILPGQRPGKPLSGMAMAMLMRRMQVGHFTVHGFRSAFRDWHGEETVIAREVAEAALAHLVGDDVERAYRRGDALKRRRELMEAWSDYLDEDTTSSDRISLLASKFS